MTHRIANALRRLADWLEPQSMRDLLGERGFNSCPVEWTDKGKDDPYRVPLTLEWHVPEERLTRSSLVQLIRESPEVRAAIQDCVEWSHPGSVSYRVLPGS